MMVYLYRCPDCLSQTLNNKLFEELNPEHFLFQKHIRPFSTYADLINGAKGILTLVL